MIPLHTGELNMAIPTLNDTEIQAFLDTLGKELKPGSRSPTSVLAQVFLTGVLYGRNNPVPAYTGPFNPRPAATKVNPDSQAQGWMSGDKHSSKGDVKLDAVPIPMILHCPLCHEQHIDEPTPEWSNPPHKSHLCLHCGVIWRPAAIPTTGVRELHSRGSKDTWPTTKPADHLQEEELEVSAKVNESDPTQVDVLVYTGSPTVHGPKEYSWQFDDAEVESQTPPTFPGKEESTDDNLGPKDYRQRPYAKAYTQKPTKIAIDLVDEEVCMSGSKDDPNDA